MTHEAGGAGPQASRKSVVVTFPPIGESSNPYQRLLYESLAKAGIRLAPTEKLRAAWLWRHRREIGILHFHWLSQYYRGGAPVARLLLLGLRLLFARVLGYRLAWTVHEIYPHDRRDWADGVAPRIVARLADVLIVHDAVTRGRVEAELGRRPLLIPHASFAGVYSPAARSSSDVRRELAISDDAVLILLFGLVRRYKRIEDLLDALSLLPETVDVELVVLVAGQVIDAELGDALRAASEEDARLRLKLGLVPDEEVSELFDAADAALLTRVDDGTSGVLALALSLGVPVITAETPGYRELTVGASGSWSFVPGDPASLADALVAAARSLAAGHVAHSRQDPLPSWADVAERTAAALRG